jgi:hypothetical protein
MNELDTAASTNDGTIDEINLRPFIRANESWFRDLASSLVFGEVSRAIGKENLGKVTLTLWGEAHDDLALHVEGPDDLKAKIEEAFRNCSRGIER